jgi:hypothetical protein
MRRASGGWLSLALTLAAALAWRLGSEQEEHAATAEVEQAAERVQEIAARALELPADRPLQRWAHFSAELQREFGPPDSADSRAKEADVQVLEERDEEFARNVEAFLKRLRESDLFAQGYRLQIVGGEPSHRFPSSVVIGDGKNI